ncbi:MAG: GHKL domain-containing protein [Flavobacteriales bacterium]|nr:GHKL domain-containing protein [Flavobacteriales bacterium]
MPRPILFLLLSALFAVLAWSVQEPDGDALLQEEAVHLQRALDRQAKDLAQGSAYWARELAELGPADWMVRHARMLEKERTLNGTVYLGFTGDSLVCWSGPLPAGAANGVHGEPPGQRTLPDAVYQHTVTSVGLLSMHAFGPVWKTPPIENRHLERGFHPALRTTPGLIAQPANGSGPLVNDANGKPLLRLAWRNGALDVGPWIILKLVLLLASAFFLLAVLWVGCAHYLVPGQRWVGITGFLVLLFILRWGVLSFIPSAPFDRLPLFDPATYAASFAFPSLGDLLINATLLVFAAVFIRKAMRVPGSTAPSAPVLLLLWGVLLAIAAWVTSTIIGLVNDSSVDLDLYHVQSLNAASAVAVLSIAMLFIAWLLLADTCIHALSSSRSPWLPLTTGLLVIITSIVLHHMNGIRDTVLFLWPVPLLFLLFHADRTRLRFVHVVIGLGALSAVTSHVLTKYTRAREQRERLVLAERLSVREDPVVELLFREMAPTLRRDPAVHALIASTRPCSAGDLDVAVRQVYFGGYWERYAVRVFAFDAAGRPRCSTDGSSPRSLDGPTTAFSAPTALADMPDLYFEQGGSEGPFYHARLAVMPQETATPVQLIIELHPRSAAQSLGFPDLLLSGDDPLARRTDRYAVARYEKGILVDQSNATGVPLHWSRKMGEDGLLWYTEDGVEYLAKGSVRSTLLTLGTPVPSLIDRATTFSYLFALFSLLLAAAMLVRTLWLHRGIPPMGIGAKVRAALLLFAVVGLLFFGFGAQRLLTRQYVQRTEANSLEKARSAHMELQQKLDGQPVLDEGRSRYLEHLLAQLSNVLFSDITIYDHHGNLLASSRPQVFSAGLIGERMDAVAYARLVIEQASSFVHEESIGTATYQSAYLPLRDRRGDVLGYIALPSFADQRQQEQERSGVLVAVVNLFVLLFALSVLVALFISNWTTRPLELLKRSLSGVALQGENTPITYRGRDEVGQLVEVYNRKVDELRESAEKLARSERESAWREMARQVAHEIKNPLTPMKLGIQHFEHTWDPEAPDAKERLERFSHGMVQQIDALNGVATAFSQFAQMPIAQPQPLDLKAVVRAAVDVFQATPGITITLHDGPSLSVNADREHLLRVFNNLLKNAVQAIPEGRDGQVHVRLRHDGNEAIVEVADNGEGISEEVRERIFTPSFTTKNSGMGLGLAMVKRMVEQAGGRVWFDSIAGNGTTFHVALPLRA